MFRSQSVARETAILVLLTLSRGAKSRKKILFSLLSGPKNCNQLSSEIGLDWWGVQNHLQRLLSEKLVESLDCGKLSYYEITSKGEEALKLAKKALNIS
ncbi:MAG: winged helix-turn-helix domain-containing protein [Candidatus Bathyarchaeia archaeon]|jgi:predicted transcriptional regulator